MSSISLVESESIMSELFEKYIQNIQIDNISLWDFETISEEAPAIMVKQLSNATKTKTYIGGSYEAEISFMIVYRCDANDTRAVLDGTTPLYRLGATFDEETKNRMKNIQIDGIVPLAIEMVATPEKNDIENNVADFMATFLFRYKRRNIT